MNRVFSSKLAGELNQTLRAFKSAFTFIVVGAFSFVINLLMLTLIMLGIYALELVRSSLLAWLNERAKQSFRPCAYNVTCV